MLSLHTGFTDRSTDMLKDLDQALVIGSIAVVLGGSALGVLIGGQMSRRLRKAAAAANQVAKGETDVRVRDAIGGVVRDETDDLARAVDAMADALQQRLEAERRVTADIAHELRTPVTGLLTAAELLPPGRPDRAGPGPGAGACAPSSRTSWRWPGSTAPPSGPSSRTSARRVRRPAGGGQGPGRRGARGARVGGHDRSAPSGAGPGQPAGQRRPARQAARSRSPSRAASSGSATTAPASPRTCSPRARAASAPAARTARGTATGSGLTIAAGQARVLGARLTFRNVRPAGAPEDVPAEGAVAVLWLPEHAPTATGSYPVLP